MVYSITFLQFILTFLQSMLTSPEVEIPDYKWNYLYAYPGHSKEQWKVFSGKAHV